MTRLEPDTRIKVLTLIDQSEAQRARARDMRLNGPRLMRLVWAWQWRRWNRHINNMKRALERE